MAGKIATRQLGKNGPFVSSVGLGTMGIGLAYGKTNNDEVYEALTYAADRGVTFWDTADIYGTSESVIGDWFTKTGRRSEIFLATKFGGYDLRKDAPIRTKPNSKPDYIKGQLAASLAALKTDHIDLYYQHRVDAEVPIEIVLETLRPYVENGTIKWLGLSECSVASLKRAKAVPGLGEKIVAVQVEFSPFETEIEETGLAAAIVESGASVVAYSPLGRGMVTGKYRSPADFADDDARKSFPRFSAENFPNNVALADKFQVVGDKYNASSSQVALAWIIWKGYFPIPGTRQFARVQENAGAADLSVSTADFEEISKLVEAAEIKGPRYPTGSVPQGDCIPLEEWKP